MDFELDMPTTRGGRGYLLNAGFNTATMLLQAVNTHWARFQRAQCGHCVPIFIVYNHCYGLRIRGLEFEMLKICTKISQPQVLGIIAQGFPKSEGHS